MNVPPNAIRSSCGKLFMTIHDSYDVFNVVLPWIHIHVDTWICSAFRIHFYITFARDCHCVKTTSLVMTFWPKIQTTQTYVFSVDFFLWPWTSSWDSFVSPTIGPTIITSDFWITEITSNRKQLNLYHSDELTRHVTWVSEKRILVETYKAEYLCRLINCVVY